MFKDKSWSLFSFEFNIRWCNVRNRRISIAWLANDWFSIDIVGWSDGTWSCVETAERGDGDEATSKDGRIEESDCCRIEWRLCSIRDEHACITCGNAWKVKEERERFFFHKNQID